MDAATRGEPLAAAAETSPELAAALERWPEIDPDAHASDD
jgi:ribulose 1,5-bisphosphate carboxylase large subunit-like protein